MKENKRSLRFMPSQPMVIICLVIIIATSIPPFSIKISLLLLISLLAVATVDFFFATKAIKISSHFPKSVGRTEKVPFQIEATLERSIVKAIRQPSIPEIELANETSNNDKLDSVLIPIKRGRYRLPSAATRVVGPLRLISSDHVDKIQNTIDVYPNLPGARHFEELRKRGRFSHELGSLKGKLGLGTEFEAIREYDVNDDYRQINWIASARFDRPMSNTFRLEENKTALCLIDAGRLMAAPTDNGTRFDLAIDASIYLATAAETLLDRLGAIVFSNRVVRNISFQRKPASIFTNSFFDLEPELIESDFAIPFQLAQKLKKSTIILFTDIVSESSSRHLLEAAKIVRKKHKLTIVIPVDVDFTSALTATANRKYDAYRQLVAYNYLAIRKNAVLKFKMNNINVVEAEPDNFAKTALRSYLRSR